MFPNSQNLTSRLMGEEGSSWAYWHKLALAALGWGKVREDKYLSFQAVYERQLERCAGYRLLEPTIKPAMQLALQVVEAANDEGWGGPKMPEWPLGSDLLLIEGAKALERALIRARAEKRI